jgi:hypothetical protein
MVGSAAYSASATVVAMAKGNGRGKGVRGGASAGTNKVSSTPFHLNLNWVRSIESGAIIWRGAMQRGM